MCQYARGFVKRIRNTKKDNFINQKSLTNGITLFNLCEIFLIFFFIGKTFVLLVKNVPKENLSSTM